MEQGRDEEAGRSAAAGAGGGSNPIPIPDGAANRQIHDDLLYHQNPTAARGQYLHSVMHGYDSSSTEEGSDQEPAPAAAAVSGNRSRGTASQLDTGSSGSNLIPIPSQQANQQFPLPSEIRNNPTALGNLGHPGMLPRFSDIQYPSGHNRHQGMLPGEVAMARRPSGDVIRTGSISQLLGQAHDMGQPSRASRQTVDVRHPAPEPRTNIIPAATGHNRHHQEMLPAEVSMVRGPSAGNLGATRTGSISQLLGQAVHDMGQPSRASRQTVDVRHPAPNPRTNIIPAATAAAEPIGYLCPLCGRDLTLQPAAQGQVNRRVLLPTAAVLSCGHAFHADCLERITTDQGCSTDEPRCPVCHPVPGRGGRQT